jgi:hypothetical protein
LFLDCPFSTRWAWLQIQIDSSLEPFQIIESFRDQLRVPFFMEVIILMCWTIWRARNGMIFRKMGPNLSSSKEHFKEELQTLAWQLKRRF